MMGLLREGGIRSTAELARRLDTSEGLVSMMTDDLVRRGYLAPVDTGCSTDHCSGCGLSAACSTTPSATMPLLVLTEKGRRAAM